MNCEEKYNKYALCREMLETVNIVRSFDQNCVTPYLKYINKDSKILLTGEGSSRIFPAGHTIYRSNVLNFPQHIIAEGGRQAAEYDLGDAVVIGISNSGKTKEVAALFSRLSENCHERLLAITAHNNTPIGTHAQDTYHLICGKEEAVAATKSVIEQALFLDALILSLNGRKLPDTEAFSRQLELVLKIEIESEIISVLKQAETIYFAGRNNGVAEELALKANEICKKRSCYLEGTYLVHGVEEVLDVMDVVVYIDPFPEDMDKFNNCLRESIGVKVIAISSKNTIFPTIVIPEDSFYTNYLELVAGWNLLVETGLAMKADLDHAERARKIGNELTEKNNL